MTTPDDDETATRIDAAVDRSSETFEPGVAGPMSRWRRVFIRTSRLLFRKPVAVLVREYGDPATRMKYGRLVLAYLFASGIGGCAFSAVIFLGAAVLFLSGAKNPSAFLGGAFDIDRLGAYVGMLLGIDALFGAAALGFAFIPYAMVMFIAAATRGSTASLDTPRVRAIGAFQRATKVTGPERTKKSDSRTVTPPSRFRATTASIFGLLRDEASRYCMGSLPVGWDVRRSVDWACDACRTRD